MVAGHLRLVQDIYHIVLSYKDSNGVKKTPSISTGLQKKGNQRFAEALLASVKSEFNIPVKQSDYKVEKQRMEQMLKQLINEKIGVIPTITQEVVNTFQTVSGDMLFHDYMIYWLSIIKGSVRENTYATYKNTIETRIVPYFMVHPITLKDIKPINIQEYYRSSMEDEKVKPATVIRRHANIRKALAMAVDMELIDRNPADRVVRPKAEHYEATVYDNYELEKLLKIGAGTVLELAIFLGAYYGMRREEIVGLKWTAIDFKLKTLTIRHTVTQYTLGKQNIIHEADCTKTQKSKRTLPLIEPLENLLLQIKEKQLKQMTICKDSYDKQFIEYIYVNDLGNRIKPNYITVAFSSLLKKNNMKHIRFHDLRHSCATLLYKSGVSLKQVQEWLGHSDITTTADIYTHFDYNTKLESANALCSILQSPNT